MPWVYKTEHEVGILRTHVKSHMWQHVPTTQGWRSKDRRTPEDGLSAIQNYWDKWQAKDAQGQPPISRTCTHTSLESVYSCNTFSCMRKLHKPLPPPLAYDFTENFIAKTLSSMNVKNTIALMMRPFRGRYITQSYLRKQTLKGDPSAHGCSHCPFLAGCAHGDKDVINKV